MQPQLADSPGAHWPGLYACIMYYYMYIVLKYYAALKGLATHGHTRTSSSHAPLLLNVNIAQLLKFYFNLPPLTPYQNLTYNKNKLRNINIQKPNTRIYRDEIIK